MQGTQVQSLVLKSPCTAGQLGLRATTSGLVPRSLGAAAAETHIPWSPRSRQSSPHSEGRTDHNYREGHAATRPA